MDGRRVHNVVGQNDGSERRHFERQGDRVEEKYDGIDGFGGFDKEGDEALSTPLINFIT